MIHVEYVAQAANVGYVCRAQSCLDNGRTSPFYIPGVDISMFVPEGMSRSQVPGARTL